MFFNQVAKAVKCVRVRFRRAKAVMCLTLVCVVGSAPGAIEPVDAFNFDSRYFGDMLFLHPYVNYGVPLSWRLSADTLSIAKTFMMVNYGSVSVDKLSADVNVAVNAPIGAGFWARYQLLWKENFHRTLTEEWNFFGFEKYIIGPFSAFARGNLDFDKHEVDILYGLSLSDSLRTRFVQAALIDEDHFYRKNDLGGISEQQPLGIVWEGAYKLKSAYLYSNGYYSRGFKRMFPDTVLSPELREHDAGAGRSVFRAHFPLSNTLLAQACIDHYTFRQRQSFSNSAQNFDYRETIVHSSIRSSLRISARHGIVAGLHGVLHNAHAEGVRRYVFERRDLIPSVAYEFYWRSVVLSAMAAAAWFRADLDAGVPDNDRFERDFQGKVRIAARFIFSPRAGALFSYSKGIPLPSFNGMNGQFIAGF